MATAIELLDRQMGRFVDPSVTERGAESVDINDFLLDVARDNNISFDIASAITDGYIERTMDGATTLEVTIHDPTNELLKSGMFGDGTFFKFDQESPYRDIDPRKPHFKAIDVLLDGLWFRLVQIQKNGHDITLTFEDRIVSFLKLHNSPRKASRGTVTRAQFLRTLVREVKAEDINFVSPELDVKQPVDEKKLKHVASDVRRHKRKVGLLATTDLNIKGVHATNGQLRNAESILDVGTAMGGNRKVLVVGIMVPIQESSILQSATNGSHVGTFQQDETSGSVWRQLGGATRDVVKDAKAFFHVAIANDKNDPGMTLAELAESVQHSGQGSLYGQWSKEAKKIVDEYSGGDGTGTGNTTAQHSFYKQYEYHRGQPDGPHKENTWECAARLADEVQWRRFVVGNSFFYVKDADLIMAKPVMDIHEDDDGIDDISWDVDSEKPISEATVECRADRWFAHPGEVAKLNDQGPASGRWLVWTIHRPLFAESCTVTLRQPQATKPEPAPELVTISTSSDTTGIPSGGVVKAGSIRDAMVKAANLAISYNKDKYTYQEVRPIPRSLFQKGMIVTDCSGFVTLVYKAAGATDPNQNSYNGDGNTGSLIAHGKSIHSNKASPGDLVFYGGTASYPGHVALYLGNGKVASFGSQGGPRELDVNYRSDLIGFYTYHLRGSDAPPVDPRLGSYPDSHGGGR